MPDVFARPNRCFCAFVLVLWGGMHQATTSQLLISYTIRAYGALLFATVQTTRQFLSILISCVLFSHIITTGQAAGTAMVFGALFYKCAWGTLHLFLFHIKRRVALQSRSIMHARLIACGYALRTRHCACVPTLVFVASH